MQDMNHNFLDEFRRSFTSSLSLGLVLRPNGRWEPPSIADVQTLINGLQTAYRDASSVLNWRYADRDSVLEQGLAIPSITTGHDHVTAGWQQVYSDIAALLRVLEQWVTSTRHDEL